MVDILPDSRTKERKGIIVVKGENYVPIYCINCGKSAGLVPEKLITHVTALCDDGCSGKYGDLVSNYEDPDSVFRKNLGEALGEGKIVTPEELDQILKNRTNPALEALAKDWYSRVSKENK